MPVAWAQTADRGSKLVGYDVLAEQSIFGTALTFPERVEHCFYDVESGSISVLQRGTNRMGGLRTKGALVVYNLDSDKVHWSRKVRFFGSSMFQPGGFFLENKGVHTTLSYITDGRRKWKKRHEAFFVHQPEGLSIGYYTQGKGLRGSTLEALELSSGKALWRRELPREVGWNDYQQIDDSTYLITSEGLHLLNVRSGEGWSYQALTHQKTVSSLHSNVLDSEGDYFMASRDRLVRIEGQSGRIKWSAAYPVELGSASLLFADDSSLYMLNMGIAGSHWGLRRIGEPFIAAFDKHTGIPHYFLPLDGEQTPVFAGEERKDELLVLRNGILENYSKKDGSKLAVRNFEGNDDGYPMQFLPAAEVFTKLPDGRYLSLWAQDSSSTFVLMQSGMIMALGPLLEQRFVLDIDALWMSMGALGPYTMVCDGERTLVVDSSGAVRAELKAPLGELYDERYLVYHDDDQCVLIDLVHLLKD